MNVDGAKLRELNEITATLLNCALRNLEIPPDIMSKCRKEVENSDNASKNKKDQI
jgi:hypothetical protein